MEMLKIFANCLPVKGAMRSIIYDLQRQKYDFISNSLADMLLQYDGKTLEEIKSAYNNQYNDIIDEYVEFLISKEYAFFTHQPELYPELSLYWDEPSTITNAIICDRNSKHPYGDIFKQLDALNCKALQWRFFHLESLSQLDGHLKLTDDLRLQHIEIIMPWVGELHIDEYKKLVHSHQRIWHVRIFNAPYTRTDYIDPQKHHPLAFTTENVADNFFCGNIFPNNFRINIKLFTEAQQYNTCLNRKVTIDEQGAIKNCLSMDESFGNINTDDIKTVIETPAFQKKWHIKKDDINVCHDCEFRYMCIDCRAFLNDSEMFNQPAKCAYNPYIAKWKGQVGYMPVDKTKNN